MNSADVNFNSLRQPAPSVAGDLRQAEVADKKQAKIFNIPNVGVVDVPTISKTPMADTLVIKKQENPRTIYKLTSKGNKGFNLQNFFSLSMVGCAIAALLSGRKKG